MQHSEHIEGPRQSVIYGFNAVHGMYIKAKMLKSKIWV